MKAVKVKMDKHSLELALGFKLHGNRICDATVEHRYWMNPYIVLVITGDDLPDEFEVKEGEMIKEGLLIVHYKEVSSEIKAI